MTKANTPEWLKSELTHVDAAAARGQLEQTSGLRAQSAHYDTCKKLIVIDLVNGSSFSLPPQLAQGLAGARPSELAEIEITPQGSGLQTTFGAESGLTPGLSFAQRINQRFKGLGDEALAVPARQDARPAPNFDAS